MLHPLQPGAQLLSFTKGKGAQFGGRFWRCDLACATTSHASLSTSHTTRELSFQCIPENLETKLGVAADQGREKCHILESSRSGDDQRFLTGSVKRRSDGTCRVTQRGNTNTSRACSQIFSTRLESRLVRIERGVMVPLSRDQVNQRCVVRVVWLDGAVLGE